MKLEYLVEYTSETFHDLLFSSAKALCCAHSKNGQVKGSERKETKRITKLCTNKSVKVESSGTSFLRSSRVTVELLFSPQSEKLPLHYERTTGSIDIFRKNIEKNCSNNARF